MSPTDENNKGFVLSSAISGFIAVSSAKLITHPLDTVKSKLQIHRKDFKGIREMISFTYKTEGFKGFYRGIFITILGSIPASSLYFGSYEKAKKYMSERYKGKDFIIHLCSGMFAELVSCIVFVPVDIIRERRQVQSNLNTYNYTSDFDALVKILKKEGVRGIYKAYMATVASFGPTTALYFMFYEKFKNHFVRNDREAYLSSMKNKEVIKLTLLQSIGCSLFASSLSSFITSPLDLVKFRMQVQRADAGYDKSKAEYRNLVQGLYVILRKEGVLALYRGVQARVISMTPQGTIVMTLVEQLKPIIAKILKEEKQ